MSKRSRIVSHKRAHASQRDAVRSSGQDAGQPLIIHLLDVGSEQYGDCILVSRNGRNILIDAGHPGNLRSQNGAPSIPAQLEHLIGPPPFDLDLLVVTHCHLDHIGCMPELVAQFVGKVKWALVADEALGYPHHFGAAGGDLNGDPARQFADVAFEEPPSPGLTDGELQQFLADAAALPVRYRDMLKSLEQAGTTIVRYGPDDTQALEAAFTDFGLRILGPSKQQLELCRDFIAEKSQDFADQYRASLAQADFSGKLALLRRLIRTQGVDAQDRVGPGAAKNNQSIVFSLSADDATVLLTGDMQFAEPEVVGLDDLMQELRNNVQKAGPYTFVKLPHHGSYNGANDPVVSQDWAHTTAFASSNGTNDATHPAKSVLDLLRQDGAHLARTDRNGQVAVTFAGGTAHFTPSRGTLDDWTPNTDSALSSAEAAGVRVRTSTTQLPNSPGLIVSAQVPAGVGRLTLDVQVTPSSGSTAAGGEVASAPVAARDSVNLASGRSLPHLLFVSNRKRLVDNIGQGEADGALRAITEAKHAYVDLDGGAQSRVRDALRDRAIQGVVIVGGYDVVPAKRLDVLDPALRATLGSRTRSDADNYIVWSDDFYGDRDGDELPELPVSRIPDGRLSALVVAALSASPIQPQSRFGVRNVARPFADGVYQLMSGNQPLMISQPTNPNTLGALRGRGDHLYFMLHGSDEDGTRFWGERGGTMLEAMNLSNVEAASASVVFTGCCWGAMPVDTMASLGVQGTVIGPRTPDNSIALRFLLSGTLAYIGCTGSHYSPTDPPFNYFGGPMHKAFWSHYIEGMAPAAALFAAKTDYVDGIPHGRDTPELRAVELKILRQYTCLGLGW